MKLSFQDYWTPHPGPSRYPPGLLFFLVFVCLFIHFFSPLFCQDASTVTKWALALRLHFLAISFRIPPVSFRILPGTNSNLFRQWEGASTVTKWNIMEPGSQIALFGKCSFRTASSFLPDFTRDEFEPFQASLLQTIMENSKPSGFTSGNPSGTFRIITFRDAVLCML